MWRSTVYRIAAVLVGLTAAVVIAEVTLRVLDLAPTDGVVTVTSKEFESIPGIFAPNQSVLELTKPTLPHRVTTNSLGYRGADFPRDKPAGEYRIVLVGDSGTWGDFVDDDETLPAQLEARLGDRCDQVLVVNAGLGGSSIISQSFMARRSLVLDPDLILLKFNENDITDLAQVPIWTRLADNRDVKSSFPLSLVYPILRRTALWNLGLRVRAKQRNRETQRAMATGRERPAARNTSPPGEVELRLRDEYAAALSTVRDTMDARGIPLVLLVAPSHKTVAGTRTTELLEWVTGVAVELGIPTVDLMPPLSNSGLGVDELTLLPYDGHASPRAYALQAEYLAGELVRAHLPADRCGFAGALPGS